MTMKFESNERIQKQAAEYVARLYSGELSAKEELSIREWCAADTAHQREFDNMVAIWDTSQELYENIDNTNQVTNYRIALTVAASIIMVLVLGLYIILPHSNSLVDKGYNEHLTVDATKSVIQSIRSVPRHYQTAIGEVLEVTLPDGTLVSLNTDTSIDYDFSGELRKLTLRRGEAFFDVAKDPSRAFVIDTGEQVIRVIGTEFNVRKNSDLLQVAVKEGVVAVRAANRKDERFALEAEDTVLLAGTIGAFSGAGKLVSTDQTDKVERLQTWRYGFFSFDNETMKTVVAEINRYHSKPVILVDEETKNLRVSGVYSLQDQAGLFSALEQVLPIRVLTESERIYIEAKKS